MKPRNIIDFITRLLGKLKKNQRVHFAGEIAKLNLGCGLAVYGDWINIDGSLNALIANWPSRIHRIIYRLTGANRYYTQQEYCRILKEHRFVHHDLSYGIPAQNDSVAYVYTSHFLEHLFRKDAEVLLKEAHRVLKPQGVLRISVPDLAYAVSLYAENQKEKMLQNYFFVDDDDSYYARHKYMYDFQLLKELLERAGFHDIRRCSFQSGMTPDIQVLDNRPEDSLFVEAVK